MSDVIKLRSEYMSAAFGDLNYVAEDLRNRLDTFNDVPIVVDTLVGTGLSGALVVPDVARILKLNWVVVRKPGESSHSSYPFEGILGQRWLFVDDRVETGETLRRVRAAIDDGVARYGAAGVSTVLNIFGGRRQQFTTTFVGWYKYMYPRLNLAE
jgi:adenine/guanine phosphoribosyltransferase-like PRPP-binding protein